MRCPHCGQVNQASASVCERCGRTLNAASSAIPFQPPPASTGRPAPTVMPTLINPVTSNRATKRSQPGDVPRIEVQCRVCSALSSKWATCWLCGAPPGLIANPGDSTGGTFLPIGMLYPPRIDAIQAVPDRPLPPALANLRWNWGAFGASLLWLVGQHLWGWALIVLLLDAASLLAYYGPLYLLIPYSGALLSLLLGAQGHFLAWQKQANSDETSFLRSQTQWKRLGMTILPLKIAAIVTLTWLALNSH